MAANRITFHQAFYGEVNRAHSCIKQTLSDPDLTSFLIAFTDRPAALPPGVTLSPYISGSSFLKYYIFTKTFPDTSASRAGMVFTHVLILSLEDVTQLNNLDDVLSHFVESTENKFDELQEIQVELSDSLPNFSSRQQPKYIQETISAYTSGVSPILFTGDIASFTNALQLIWNSPNLSSRKKIKFRTSFTLSDIDGIKDLSIVSIQKDFLTKWHGQKIIQGENQEKVEIISHSEALFLGHKSENPFYNFLQELNVNLSEVQNYAQFEKVFNNYTSIDKLEDTNILRQDIRTIAKISPTPKEGKIVKDKFIERITTLIQNKKDYNLKALRNIDWAAFDNGEAKGKKIVSSFMETELENQSQKQFQLLSELIDISITEKEQNWWHKTIKEALIYTFQKQSAISLSNIWQLIDLAEITSRNLLPLFLTTQDCDVILRKSIPEKLRDETCVSLTSFAKANKFYLLHADILLKQFSIEESIEIQLKLEERLTLTNSVGLKYLAEKLPSEKLIDLTIKVNDTKLIELSVEAIEKNTALLKNLDVSIPSWLNIWTAFVLKTKKIFAGLTGNEAKTVSSVLDLILIGKTVDDTVISLIANSPFSDITNYKHRSKIWTSINPIHKEIFLTETTKTVFNNLLSGKIESKSIESEISDRITSDSFLTKFLSDNRNNIEPILIVFSGFENLKDNFLSDYITNYRGVISAEQSIQLGELVSNKKFQKSARSIYDKAKYNPSFTPASEICKPLVSLNWFETIFSFGSQPSRPVYSHTIPVLSKEDSIRVNLPTVIILTAIKEEYMAVRDHLNEIVDADKNDTAYEAGLFQYNGKEIAKVVIRECGAKNTNAAQETERAIQYFKPDMILFVGIAGSRKPKDFKVGDVIFPEKVYSYEGGKSEKEAFLSRPDNALMSYSLLEKAKKERKKDDWKILIKGDWKEEVKADIGIIASGEQVIEHYDSEIGKILHDHFNDTSAVEMEGFGFGKAANRQGRETSNILIGVVRGISDVIEQSSKKGKNKNEDRRPANAKDFASATAAAFAFWLILKTYE